MQYNMEGYYERLVDIFTKEDVLSKLKDVSLLTDQYAPVEYLVAKDLSESDF